MFCFIFAVSSDLPRNEDNTVLWSMTKLYIVIGCIAALVLVAIMQAGCTIYKTVTSPAPHHKVKSEIRFLRVNRNRVFRLIISIQ